MDEGAKKSKELHNQALDYESKDLDTAVRLYEEAIKTDPRNVLTYHNLAKIYLTKYDDLEKAEEYCRKGYEVQDIPPEITSAPVWLDDIHEEVHADLDLWMMYIRLQQGRINEARHYLNNIKSFHDKYSKGNYDTARQIFEKYEEKESTESAGYASSAGSKSGCLSLLSLLVVPALTLVLFLILR